MSALNFAFVDQVLPRTNARLRGLLIDIGRKKPTLELREQVINEVPPSQYFLRAGRIDAATGRLKDITIYDVGGESSRRIIYADSGRMAYDEGRTDLNLRLYDGSIHQYRPSDPLTFQLTYYRVNDIRVKDVYDELVRNSSENGTGRPRDEHLRDALGNSGCSRGRTKRRARPGRTAAIRPAGVAAPAFDGRTGGRHDVPPSAGVLQVDRPGADGSHQDGRARDSRTAGRAPRSAGGQSDPGTSAGVRPEAAGRPGTGVQAARFDVAGRQAGRPAGPRRARREPVSGECRGAAPSPPGVPAARPKPTRPPATAAAR